MPAAVIGGVIAGAGAIGAAAIGSGAQSKASNQATQAAQYATDQNAALQRDIYGQNKGILAPYVQSGYGANALLNGFLGVETGGPATAYVGQPNALAQTGWGVPPDQGGMPDAYGRNALSMMAPEAQYGTDMVMPGLVTGYGSGTFNPDGTQVTTGGNGTPSVPVNSQSAQNAFRNYIANSDYGFTLNNGSNALNSGYAGAGTLQSGAAMKAMEAYRQNLQSGYRNEYMGYLTNQQGVGLSAGNALAGVGTNYANNMSGQNNAMASVIANSALARAQGQAQLWGGVGNAFGQIGGVIAGRKM